MLAGSYKSDHNEVDAMGGQIRDQPLQKKSQENERHKNYGHKTKAFFYIRTQNKKLEATLHNCVWTEFIFFHTQGDSIMTAEFSLTDPAQKK